MPDQPDQHPEQPEQPNQTSGAPADHASAEPDTSSLPPLTTAPSTAPTSTTATTRGEELGDVDEANRSLADALAFSFKVLRWVMLLLIVLFLFSGFFTVQQNQVAVRTTFGRISPGPDGSEVLTPEGGPYFRWPAPVGQVYYIPTETRSVAIDEAFVFAAATTPQNQGLSLADITAGPSLDPTQDGALLTGDKNLVHARYSVGYRIPPEGASSFIRNVASLEELERGTDNPAVIFSRADQVVRMAVEEAIVADAATKTIDAFRRGQRSRVTAPPTPSETPATPEVTGTEGTEAPAAESAEVETADDGEPAAEGEQAPTPETEDPAADEGEQAVEVQEQDQIKAHAQRILDELGTGIQITEVLLTDQTVPPTVRNAFDDLTRALQQREEFERIGETQATSIYTQAAGRAYPAVMALLDAYEEADRLREEQPELFQQLNTAVDRVFSGQPIGEVLVPLAESLPEDFPQREDLLAYGQQFANEQVGGQAASQVRSARATATGLVEEMRAEARNFEELLADYRRAPELVQQNLYYEMWQDLFAGETNRTEFLPGSRKNVIIRMGENVELERQQEQEQRQQMLTGPSGMGGPPRR